MRIPSVHQLKERLAQFFPEVPFNLFTNPARKVAQILRESFQKGEVIKISEEELNQLLIKAFREYQTSSLKRVINATGVIVHTNLGRAPLPPQAVEEIRKVALYYSNLEYNLEKGRRGTRYEHVEGILKELTGAEGVLVVNNNASAVLIALNTLAKDKEVIVSRGELIEIGGSFRIPEVMSWAGCILKEVGTTNKTHLYDYEKAINENTALLLKVHKSNYAIVGFTEEVFIEELVALGKKYNLPVMVDLGSGCFIDFSKYGLSKEPTVQEVLKAEVDLVTFSGDKLLGGPQAGILLGKKEIIERIRQNPLNRAVRIDKLTLAGLWAILNLYRDEKLALENIPVLRMIFIPKATLLNRAKRLLRRIKSRLPKADTKIVRTLSKTGGGALPVLDLPSYGVAFKLKGVSPQTLQEKLRKSEPPVIAISEEDWIILDVRTLFEEDIKILPRILESLSYEFFKTS